jgi:predicted DNA-binding protein (MmcQ/YjbR family)
MKKLKKEILDYAKSKEKAYGDFPFDEVTEVVKVMGRIFLLVNEEEPLEISLKCDPFRSVEMRSIFDFIRPGYHLNKKHWITVTVDGKMEKGFYFELIDHSYEMVVRKMTKAERMSLLEPPDKEPEVPGKRSE